MPPSVKLLGTAWANNDTVLQILIRGNCPKEMPIITEHPSYINQRLPKNPVAHMLQDLRHDYEIETAIREGY